MTGAPAPARSSEMVAVAPKSADEHDLAHEPHGVDDRG
jgi:hypothetical protein